MSDHALIRRLVLAEIETQGRSSNPQTGTVLYAVAQKLGHSPPLADQQYMMDVIHEQFINGTIAPGYDLSNSKLPFFHLTDRGKKSFSRTSRDPGDRDGYLAYLASSGLSDAISLSYIEEAVQTYGSAHYKSAAVMTGCAAERLVGMVRDELVAGLRRCNKSITPKLNEWKYKVMRDAISNELDAKKKQMTPLRLQEQYELWIPYTDQLRIYRNDAGHPQSIAPISAETAHANLLIFSEFNHIVSDLLDWIRVHYK